MSTENITIDVLEKRKRKAFTGLLIFFTLWQIGQIAMFNFEHLMSPTVITIFSFIILIGSLGWAAYSVYFVKLNSLLKKHPNICKQLNDERQTLVRYKAMSYGLSTIIGTSALLFAIIFSLNSFFVFDTSLLSGQFVSHLIMIIAVTSSLLAYLLLDKEE